MINLNTTNSLVTPLLTDMYQLTMAYAYWKQNKSEDHAVFDVFFRKNPFKGEFCIFAGQDEVLRFLSSFKFSDDDINYLKHAMPACDPNFFSWLSTLDCSKVKVNAIRDGSVVFPRVPLLRIEGPLAIVQLLETTILNLINFPSLIATNAARMRLAIGYDKKLLEFGLRRAQGPDGGLSASKYSYIGGFDGTSNVTAGKIFGLGVSGTHAHSFVMSYKKLEDLATTKILKKEFFLKNNNSKQSSTSTNPQVYEDEEQVEFLDLVFKYRRELGYEFTNEGELAAFISYAQSFPTTFLALLDTYDILASGLHNFIVVALALREVGYKPLGIRIDSGDLAYLSKKIREKFKFIDSKYPSEFSFAALNIVASNDISEKVLHSLNSEGHSINTFGIGTNLVTCQSQPALGCVFKLVENNGEPRIKLSQESEKMIIPCKKRVFRLYNGDHVPLLDVLTRETEDIPKIDERLLVHHPFDISKRAYVTPKYISELLEPIFDGKILYPERLYPNNWFEYIEEDSILKDENEKNPLKKMKIDNEDLLLVKKQWDSLQATRAYCQRQIKELREDHIRTVNPTPYKVSVSSDLYKYIHELRMAEHPAELL